MERLNKFIIIITTLGADLNEKQENHTEIK